MIAEQHLHIADNRPGYIGSIAAHLDVADAVEFAGQRAAQVRGRGGGRGEGGRREKGGGKRGGGEQERGGRWSGARGRRRVGELRSSGNKGAPGVIGLAGDNP